MRQLKRKWLPVLVASFVLTFGICASLYAQNPSGTGQPNQECGEGAATNSPPGFGTGGFSNAEEHYAGNGSSADHANSSHAVSQYDVACYQVSTHGSSSNFGFGVNTHP